MQLPGSKSISIRMLLLAALAEGKTVLTGVLDSDDTRVMRGALEACGVRIEAQTGKRVEAQLIVHGAGRFPKTEADIFLGNSGLSARTLVAVLAFMGGRYRLSGVPRMHERPIADLVDALLPVGAKISYEKQQGFPPLKIEPGQPKLEQAIRVRGDASSQFLTGLLQAAPLLTAKQDLVIEVEGELISKPYIDLTLALMQRFGVKVQTGVTAAGSPRYVVTAGARYVSPGAMAVEGDASSASYFLALGALTGGPIRVQGMGRTSLQGDVRFAEALSMMGASITQGDAWTEAISPGAVSTNATGFRLKAIDADFNHIPDAAMTLAVLALFADGSSTLRNIGSWRVKETDRIAAMATELRKLGADVYAGADFLRVTPPEGGIAALKSATIDTYDDHRMAMCFSLVTCAGIPIRINDPACVAKTFPTYFDELARLTQPVVQSTKTVSANKTVPVIAIDGPTASGKGTVAQRIAAALGFHYLDSGALYRLAALAAKNRNIRLNQPNEIAAVARNLEVEFQDGRIFLDGDDVTDLIRAEWVGNAASTIAVFPELRAALVQRQHAFRHAPGLVADGRDMGTVIFPDASLKVFLTATAEARAQRRHKQLIEKGISANIDILLRDLQERDARDASRSSAPLIPAEDAVKIETSNLGVDEVVNKILDLARKKM